VAAAAGAPSTLLLTPDTTCGAPNRWQEFGVVHFIAFWVHVLRKLSTMNKDLRVKAHILKHCNVCMYWEGQRHICHCR
jgi:hypothetical protein